MTTPVPTALPLTQGARRVVTFATLGFTLMFAVWVMFAIVGLPIRKELGLTDAQFTLLTAIPVLTGSLLRLPAGIWADRYGGKTIFLGNLLITAAFALALSFASGYNLLLALLEQPGRVWTREQLTERLYGWGEEIVSNSIDVHIHSLRRKLVPEYILNVRGVGYYVPKA